MNWGDYRNLFPACKEYAYFSSAAAAPIPTPVYEAITKHYQKMSHHGGSAAVDGEVIEDCRKLMAKLIHASEDEIAFVPSVAFAMNAIALSLKNKNKLVGRVILSKEEYPSCSLPWENLGYEMMFVSSQPDLEENLLNAVEQSQASTILMLSYVQYISGYKTNLDALGSLTERKRIPLILDATQVIGTTPINVQSSAIDVLAASGHKWLFCGYGLAFMYVKQDFFNRLAPALVGPRSCENAFEFKNTHPNYYQSARVFELGNMNLSAFYGLEAALKIILEIGVESIQARIQSLMQYLIQQLVNADIPIMFDFKASARFGIIQIGPFDEIEKIERALQAKKIEVISRMKGLRISLHFFNNEEDIDRLITALKQCLTVKNK